jgi:hypothetical protein
MENVYGDMLFSVGLASLFPNYRVNKVHNAVEVAIASSD